MSWAKKWVDLSEPNDILQSLHISNHTFDDMDK